MTLRVCTIKTLSLLAALATSSAALADFTIDWSTIDGGGGSLSGGPYTLSGTIGQPDATAHEALSGGSFTLTGGFWNGTIVPCPGDLNGDGHVDGADLGFLLGAWGIRGQPGFPGDVNGNGFVDGADLGGLLSAWGPCSG